MNDLYPLELSLWQVPQIHPTYNYDYISNIIANGLIQDFFVPGLAAQNPILPQVDTFNQNVGILQTATNGIDKILQYVDTIKELNPNDTDLIQSLSNDINDTIKNTTFDNIPVFKDTIQLDNQKIDLSIPTFDDANTTDIEEYEKLLKEKKEDFYNILNNISIESPISQDNKINFNPDNMETFESIVNSGNLLNAYDLSVINPFNAFELLFY